MRDLVAKQTAPTLAAPSVGLTNKFSEWKPKLVAGQEVYSNKATEVLRDIYENIEQLTKQTNKIASEVNRTDDIGKNKSHGCKPIVRSITKSMSEYFLTAVKKVLDFQSV